MSKKEIWTIETYAAHNEALREAEKKFQNERDRRYAEVKAAEEKALRVKEQADDRALGLAREIQTYKDEKANELREQINSERGLYPTRTELQSALDAIDASLKPLVEFMQSQQGRHGGTLDTRELVFALIGVAGVIIGVLLALTNP